MNVHHIASKYFENYNKGPYLREIFEALGDGIFASDSETWKNSRALLHSLLKQRNFVGFHEITVQKEVKSCLLPLLDHVSERAMEVDSQDVFHRFTFDSFCSMVLGFDPNCLSIEFPEVPYEKAFTEAKESMFYRHVMPRSFWKLQKWLGIGKAKKMREGCKVFDQFVEAYIASKRKELSRCRSNIMEGNHVDMLTAFIREEEAKGQVINEKFVRDNAFNLLTAGRDTIASALP